MRATEKAREVQVLEIERSRRHFHVEDIPCKTGKKLKPFESGQEEKRPASPRMAHFTMKQWPSYLANH
jgi:hypothetical protein